MMIKVFRSETQDNGFYALMGRYFASLDIAKELERQVYNKPNTTWYVLTYYQEVISFVSVHDNGRYYYIDNLYTLPDFRQRGNASELIDNIVHDFKDKPIRCIANNPYALKLFYSFGFVNEGKNGKWAKLVKH